MKTYLMVESADDVINILGSFGFHAHDITSATCPLVGFSEQRRVECIGYHLRCVLHVTNVRVSFDIRRSSQVMQLIPEIE